MNDLRRTALALFGMLPLLVSCSKPEQPGAAASTAPRGPSIDSRNQYALIDDLDEALAAPAGEQARRYGEVKSAWLGRRVRWEVRYVPALCARADSCFVVAVDYSQSKKRIIQGWLPRFEIDAAMHEKIQKDCAPHLACVIDVEAKITRLVASADLPTAVTFGEVSLIGARDEKSTESWGRAPAEPVAQVKPLPNAALALHKR